MTNPTEILSLLLLVVGLSLMLVVHILVVLCALWRRRHGSRRGAPHANQERVEDAHGRGLSADELDRLPCHDVEAADAAGAGDCAVCLEAFEVGDRCRQLPRCEHSFHAECVDSWLKKSSACPVCRADVLDRPPKGDAKAAASSSEVVEMANRRNSNTALEIVIAS